MAFLKNNKDNNDNYFSNGYSDSWFSAKDGNSADEWSQLGLEDLENIAGGVGDKSGYIEEDGIVLALVGNGVFQVNVGQQTVSACLSGKMRMNYVRVMPGDSVRVYYSPDTLQGRITYRYKR